MLNQQGYTDGFRLEADAGGESRVFEFIAIGSGIEVSEAIKWLPPPPALSQA